MWNSIPKFIRNVTSLQLFKEKLKIASKTLHQIQFEKEACLIKSKDSAFLYFKTLFFILNFNRNVNFKSS